MPTLYPFQPVPGDGVTYAPNTAALAVVVKKGSRQVCLTNLSTTTCYWREGVAAATAADMPILGNTQIILTKSEDSEAGSVYCAGAGSIHKISGLGN